MKRLLADASVSAVAAGFVTVLGALADEREREPALIAFLVTASGVTLAGIGAPFWGLLAGALAALVLNARRR